MISRAAFLLAACLAVSLVWGGSAIALPLDKETCEKLQAEHDAKLTPEVKEALEHGPDWVKGNLVVSKLNRIREYLLLEERIAFRCRTGRFIEQYWKIVPLPLRRPAPPASADQEQQQVEHRPLREAGQRLVSTSQTRID